MPDRASLRFARALVGVQDWLAAAALVAMMLVVVADVAMRHLIGQPLRGSYDMVSSALLVMVVFGIGGVILRGAEIALDLVDTFLPVGALRLLKRAALILTLAALVFTAWSMIGPARDAYRYGDRSLELGLPVWVLWIIAFLGMAGIMAAALARLFTAGTGDAADTGEAE